MEMARTERDRWLFLSSLAERILATADPPELIRTLSDTLLNLVGADILLNYLVDSQRDSLVLNSFAGVPREVARSCERLCLSTSICLAPTHVATGHSAQTECICHCVLNEIGKAQEIKCLVCYPLAAQGRVIGNLAFGSNTLTQFAADDQELMRTVAAQFSMAIYRMQNEQELREVEERSRILCEATFEGILVSQNGIIIDLNQQMADLIGWSMEELKGRQILSFVVPEDRGKLQESFYSDQGRRAEYRVIRKDGCQRIFEARGRPAMVQGSLRRVAAVRDITERKQLEADLLQRGKELQELNLQLEQRIKDRTAQIEHLAGQLRALSVKLIKVEQKERQYLATILHDDIQQLLVACKMRVELCINRSEHPPTVALCQEISVLLTEILDHCRSLVVELYPPVLQQRGLVEALQWLAQQYEEKHRFKVIIQAESQAEPPTHELRCLLFESARELLLNAVKYAETSHGLVTLSQIPHQEIILRVEDQGKGFEPGAQLNQTTSGFGLFSIQQRLAYIGGRMEIDSAPQQGTRVTLVIPLAS